MLLSKDDYELFFRLQLELMTFVNLRLGSIPHVANTEEFLTLSVEARIEVRKAFLDNVDLIDAFVEENSGNLGDEEINIVLSWRDYVFGTFFAFRQLKNYMVFLDSGDPPIAYGVVALSQPFEDFFGPNLPKMLTTVLLPFKGRIIYDGMLDSKNIIFGGGIKRSLNDSYREAKQRLGIVTSLPVNSAPVPVARTTKSTKRRSKKKSQPNNIDPILQTIVGMTNDFCRQHLNEEYAELCVRLAAKLARKRPSPLPRGQPKTWACGIIRTIGMVNFLDDKTTQPHMKLTAIDKAFGVGNSTGQAKSMEIRKMLKIRQFDTNWTLRSRMDGNPLLWMVRVNGFVIDIRSADRELQEVAFEKGLIPYIPADRQAINSD